MRILLVCVVCLCVGSTRYARGEDPPPPQQSQGPEPRAQLQLEGPPDRLKLPLSTNHVRWLIRKDMPQVLAIEFATAEHPQVEEELLSKLRQRNSIGMVVERGGKVVGFMIYRLDREKLELLDFRVDPKYRESDVGEAMADKLAGKLSPRQRTFINIINRETELEALNFFKSQGFRAVKVHREHFQGTGEDGIQLVYHLGCNPARLAELLRKRAHPDAW